LFLFFFVFFFKNLMAVALADFQPKEDNAEREKETEQDSACEYKTVRRYYELWLSSDFFISKPSDFLFAVCGKSEQVLSQKTGRRAHHVVEQIRKIVEERRIQQQF